MIEGGLVAFDAGGILRLGKGQVAPQEEALRHQEVVLTLTGQFESCVDALLSVAQPVNDAHAFGETLERLGFFN